MPLEPQMLFGLPSADYHADPAPRPSLSASIARLLVEKSPAHAKEAHPRLNKHWKPSQPTTEMEEGSALHTLMLGDGPDIVQVEAEDWRTDAAKYLRAKARREGKLPVLRRRYVELLDVASGARQRLKRMPAAAGLFQPGRAEVTVLWPEGTQWCRLRLDWMPDDPAEAVYDLKFTSESAAPADWEQTVWRDNSLRIPFYERGLTAARKVAPREYRLVVVETYPPYGASLFAASNDLLAYGSEQVRDALALWKACRQTNKWAAYPEQVNMVELPTWKRQQWEEGLDRPRPVPPVRKRRATLEQVAHVQHLAAELGQPSLS